MVTVSDLIAHIKATRTDKYDWLCNRTLLANGSSMSIQASEGHYCSPRSNDAEWTSLELGFPEGNINTIPLDGLSTQDEIEVIGYVPIQLVVDVINLNGGFALVQLPSPE